MNRSRVIRAVLLAFCLSATASGSPEQVVVGQDGKDVVYLPTPTELVKQMLDMAAVTPQDYVIDLGSGDGRIVIAAAKRGARALGIEYDTALVELSKQNALAEKVSDRASFIQADLFATDFSQATVVTMFLLSDMMDKLRPRLFAMKAGTRIVSNSFLMDDWPPDQTVKLPGCTTWCTAHLWIVPARVDGTWDLPQGVLTLKQTYQDLSGTLTTLAAGGTPVPLFFGRMRADEIAFTAAGAEYKGRLIGNSLNGTVTVNGTTSGWKATKR